MVAPDQYQIVFRGDISPGSRLPEVKQRLQALFKMPAERIDSLFTGTPVVLKKGLDQSSAERYRQVLEKAGAVATVSVVTAEAAAPKSSVAKKLTLAERLAQQEREQQQREKQNSRRQTGGQQNVPHRPSLASQEATQAQRGMTLAAAGADLLDAVEPTRVTEVDTSHLSVRPQSGELLDPQERPVVEAPDIDTHGITVAEQKGDLIKPEERQVVTAPELDLSSLDVMPVGADLDEIKPDHKPVNPDTSGLKLVSP